MTEHDQTFDLSSPNPSATLLSRPCQAACWLPKKICTSPVAPAVAAKGEYGCKPSVKGCLSKALAPAFPGLAHQYLSITSEPWLITGKLMMVDAVVYI